MLDVAILFAKSGSLQRSTETRALVNSDLLTDQLFIDYTFLGIELNKERADQLKSDGLKVEIADATDTDFWNQVHLSKPVEEMILLAMPNHMSNIFAAQRINASGLNCKVVAIAKHETEVEELSKMWISSFNLYLEAGVGLGREALRALAQKS